MSDTITLQELLSQDGMISSIGSPGAGKSTFFDRIENPEWLRLERDRFREALFGTRRRFWDSAVPYSVRSNAVRRAMMATMFAWPHFKVFLTDTGGTYKQINEFYSPLCRYYGDKKGAKLPLTLIVFEVSLNTLIERNESRPAEHRVPELLLMDKYEDTYGPGAWWREFIERPNRFVRVFYREQIIT